MALEKLTRGAKARSPKGFADNMKREKELGKSKKRQVGTAYGEADLAIDSARRKKRAAKEKHSDVKADKKLIKKMVKRKALK